MANQEEEQVPSHFFRAVLSPEIARLKIASEFVKYHGNTISEDVTLQVGSRSWKVGVERFEGDVWLVEGWKEFTEHYSIRFAQILMFKYKGESRFDVSIYDPSLMETRYPGKDSSERGVESDLPEVFETDEEEDEEVVEGEEEEEDDEEEFDQAEVVETDHDGEEEEDDDDDDEKIIEKRTQYTQNAWIQVEARAKAFRSSSPWFIVRMQPLYVASTKCVLCIPNEHSRQHILGKENKGMYLVREGGRSHFAKYHIGKGPRPQVWLLTSGWKDFMLQNSLRLGDVCAFELVDSANMKYKVTVFRIVDYECPQRRDKSKGKSLASHSKKKDRCSSSPRDKVLQRARAFKCQNPSFIAVMKTYQLCNEKPCLYVPVPHAKMYVLERENSGICLSNESKNWLVDYTIEGPPLFRVRLSSTGWRSFKDSNRLEAGDVCVFELVDSSRLEYKVTIFRVADYA